MSLWVSRPAARTAVGHPVEAAQTLRTTRRLGVGEHVEPLAPGLLASRPCCSLPSGLPAVRAGRTGDAPPLDAVPGGGQWRQFGVVLFEVLGSQFQSGQPGGGVVGVDGVRAQKLDLRESSPKIPAAVAVGEEKDISVQAKPSRGRDPPSWPADLRFPARFTLEKGPVRRSSGAFPPVRAGVERDGR